MNLPTIHGLIERRILVNFSADPADVEKILPPQFRPKLYKKKAIIGICLIRLKDIRPKGFPAFTGVSSENGAHRIAVEWDEAGSVKSGVFVFRRDTSLWLNTIIGGRIFPGKHHLAKFDVIEKAKTYKIAFTSQGKTAISIEASETDIFPPDSIFGSLENASDFFMQGAVGYSPKGKKLEGLELKTYTWKMRPLLVSSVMSTFFEDGNVFARGSVKFDSALLMTNIEHEWHRLADK